MARTRLVVFDLLTPRGDALSVDWRAGARRLLALALALAPLATSAEAVQKRIFATAATCDGNLGACTAQVGDTGVVAGNNFCQAAATAAGLTGGGQQFRAWVSDTSTDAYCNVLGLSGRLSDSPACGLAVLPAGGPWYRLDGLPFASSLAEITSFGGGPIVPVGVSETGAPLGRVNFFSGTSVAGAVSPAFNCTNWTTNSNLVQVSGGNTDATSYEFASGASISCDFLQHLFCLEIGPGDPLVYPSAPGALVFVSSELGNGNFASWASSGATSGLAGGDAVCRNLAVQAQLPSPSSFVAWLSTGAVSAKDRLTVPGPWKRVDGVPIASSLADLTDGLLIASVARQETGARSIDDVWTGTFADGMTAIDDCNDWTSGTAAVNGQSGRSWRSVNWTDANADACNFAEAIYCFSNRLVLGWDNFEPGTLNRWSAVRSGF